MKWIYRILRLFFCPHKYEVFHTIKEYERESDTVPSSTIIILQCNRCGKMRNHTI